MVLVLHLPGRIVRPHQGADYPALKKMFSSKLLLSTQNRTKGKIKIKGKVVDKTRIQC